MTTFGTQRFRSFLWTCVAVLVAVVTVTLAIWISSGGRGVVEELLLDEFPRHRAPSGMAAITTLSYIGMLIAVGVPIFRILIPRSANDWSIRVSYGASAIAVAAMLMLVPLTKAFEEQKETIFSIFHVEMWKVSPGHGTVRALIFTVVGLTFMMWFLERDLTVRFNRLAVFVGALFALGAFTVVGHTATLGPAYIIHGADFVHTLAAAFWVGGLVALFQYLWSSIQKNDPTNRDHSPRESARMIATFSAWALWSFAALATSGMIMEWIVAGNPFDILSTTYLRLWVMKLAILMVPVGMAVWNRFWLVPAILQSPDDEASWGKLRRAIVYEVIGIVAVLFVTGYLVLQNPEA
ncbi:MAG TPA: CopD family protein [Thermomicrobiales bacterium]|nr:CopD family protein [Thermomicrobiales bacterium]